MIVHQVFALICNNEVMNICVCDNYEFANMIARETYGMYAFAIDCLQYPCSIGDIYRNNTFYHVDENGTEFEIERIPTQEQQVIALTEENKLLQDELTNTQLALCELYENTNL